MRIDPKSMALGLLKTATPVMFFTGSPGVGKTAMAAACAQALAEAGRRVLLVVGNDPGSAFGVPVDPQATVVPPSRGLQAVRSGGPEAIAAQLAQGCGDIDHCIFDVDLTALIQSWRTQPEALPSLHRHDGLLALADPWQTTVVLVTRPDAATLRATARLHEDLAALDVGRQWLLVNGWPQAASALPAALQALPRDVVAPPADSPTPASP